MTNMNQKEHCSAILLSAGQGKRMGSNIQKQYLELEGYPIIYYSLKALEESSIIDEVIMVVGEGQEEYVRKEILEPYGFSKVRALVCGGKERYHSVWNGLRALKEDGYVFIHDGARPFLTEEILRRGYETVKEYKACVAGMPSKDTIKLVDEETYAKHTPERNYVWAVQTPQIFERRLITKAYERLMQQSEIKVTDDAMVAEQMLQIPVKLYEASYENIKITTPEDLKIARVFLEKE